MSDIQTIYQQHIAKELKLSVGTVSKALRGYPDISKTTRNKVNSLAQKMGYKTTSTRQRNQGTQSRFIGVLVKSLSHEEDHNREELDGIVNEYLHGISQLTSQLNLSPVIQFHTYDQCELILDPQHQPPAMREGLLSGLILIRRWPRQVVAELAGAMPCVAIVNKTPGLNIDVVGIDNYGGIDDLVDHLYQLGHRKIGFFGRCPEVSWSLERYAGYMAALAKRSCDYEKDWIVDMKTETIENQSSDLAECIDFEQVWRLCESGVTAFVCSTDWCGSVLHAWLLQQGLRVPDDISITGFHGGGMLAGCPPLTSVCFCNEEIGAAALRRLDYRIKHSDEIHREILFPCTFVTGQSTQEPKQA